MGYMISKKYSEKSKKLNHFNVIYFFVIVILVVNLAACSNGQNTELDDSDPDSILVVPNDGAETHDAYPVATPIMGTVTELDSEVYPAQPTPFEPSVDAYPIQEPSNDTEDVIEEYPAPEPTYATNGDRFRFDPIMASNNEVTGSAPPNMALSIVDITYAGTILGQGHSDVDGQFSVPVSGLIEGHRIGISLADIPPGETLQSTIEQLYPYRGDNYQMVPNIGVFFETTLVEP